MVEVHADGEIWVAVQMDLRDLFLSRNPSPGEATDIACAHGQIAPTACPGDRQWIQDYYDSMVMMPRNTTMIQARDAMLAADVARFGGAKQDLIWQGFAMRGFGQIAELCTFARPQVGAPELLDLAVGREDAGAVCAHIAILAQHAELDSEPEHDGVEL